MYNLKCKVKRIGAVEQVSDSFKKRDLVVTDNGQYPQTVIFQAAQDKCDALDSIKEGQDVEVSFYLNGREWTNPKDNSVVVFNTLTIKDVKVVSDF